MAGPLLSVFVPAFNAGPYIAEALESVLSQAGSDAQVVVVDDGSADDTAAVASRFSPRVRVIRAPHRGIAATVNAAIAELSGVFVGAIDADDRWLPGKVEVQLAALEADPSIDAVFGQVRQFVSPEVPAEAAARYAVTGEPIPGLNRGTMVIRREALERAGKMETDLSVGEFVSWYMRAVDAGLRMKMLPQVVYERRIHGGNTMIRERDAQTDYLRIVKATLDRRRAAGRPR